MAGGRTGGRRGVQRDLKRKKDLTCHCCFKDEGDQETRKCEWPLEAENNSWLIASKERGPQSYSHMELNSADHMDESES